MTLREDYLEKFQAKNKPEQLEDVKKGKKLDWKGRQGLIMQLFENNGKDFEFLSKIRSHWTPIRLSKDFPAEIFQTRGEWEDIFKILKEKIMATKNTIPGKAVLQK